MRVHVIQTGQNLGNKTFIRDTRWISNLRKRKPYKFPVLCFIIEHPDGLLAIDTGLTRHVHVPYWQQRFAGAPSPLVKQDEEIDSQMRKMGMRTKDVRLVVLTHLDWDHAAGIKHFSGSEILVHRAELDYASTVFGRLRYQPKLWPAWFDPTIYELDPQPYGPFPRSKSLTKSGDIRLVPIPGHTVGQIGVVVEISGRFLFFSADHALRQDWFLEDFRAGSLRGLAFFPKLAPKTSHRIMQFAKERPTVLLPSHDSETRQRLENMETLKI